MVIDFYSILSNHEEITSFRKNNRLTNRGVIYYKPHRVFNL